MATEDKSCDTEWDFTLAKNEYQLHTALYSGVDSTFLAVATLIGTIGIFANFVGMYKLFQDSKWDNLKCYLWWLATFDGLFLLAALIFYLHPAYISGSPVSFHNPFENCWALFGFLLFAQKVSAAFALAIAVETFWRICKGKPSFLDTRKSITVLSVGILVVALLTLLLGADVFEESQRHCVRWPDKPEYANHPPIIRTCSTGNFASFSHIIFHDLPISYIAAPAILYCYWKAIYQLVDVGESGRKLLNLKARIVVYALCPILAVLHNFSVVIYRTLYPDSELPFSPTSARGENVLNLIRVLLMLQPTINPFMYFIMEVNILDIHNKHN